MVKFFSILAAACCLLFAGCRHAEQAAIPPKSFANAGVARTDGNDVELQPVPDTAQTPDYQGLIAEYRSMLSRDPGNLADTIGLGNAYFESGAWNEAIEQFEKALKIDPRNADVHTDLGTAYRNMGMPERALAEYRLALQYEPGHLNARYAMGIVYGFDYRNYGLAIHVWEELLRLAPNYPRADYIRSCMLTFKSPNPHAREHLP